MIMFKKLLPLLFVITSCTSLSASIVNNSTSSVTSEDSLSFVFYSLDSLANPTTADSLYILVLGPSGEVVFKDSMAIGDSRITSTTIRSKQFYGFADQTSNLDGSGSDGHYCLTLLAYKSSQNLLTPNKYWFQIISTELSDQIAAIDDSVFVKGGAVDSNRTEAGSSVDSTLIARSVWNSPQTGHTVAGTFGKYLDTEVSGVSSGGGAYSITLITYDTTTSLTIPLAGLAVRNLTQSSLVAVGRSNSSGVAGFNLDADSFLIIASAPGYLFSVYDTVVVSGAQTDTVYGNWFDPGTPSVAGLCRMYGFLYDFNGQPEKDVTVAAMLPAGVSRTSYVIISPFEVTAITDSTGYFYIDLVPSDSLIPNGQLYEITLSRNDGTILRQRLSIPTTSTWQLVW